MRRAEDAGSGPRIGAAGRAAGLRQNPRRNHLRWQNGDPRQAIKALTEANTLLDTWIGRFDLGRAYLEAGLFTQADSEFDRCIKRRGEALVAVPGRGTHVRLLPVRLLLPGPRAGVAEERRLRQSPTAPISAFAVRPAKTRSFRKSASAPERRDV